MQPCDRTDVPAISMEDALSAQQRGVFAPSANAFDREDEGADPEYYAATRLHHHMDPAARYALRLYYEDTFEKMAAPAILELCASWASHLPELRDFGPTIGVGLNADELSRNGSLTAYVVHDLNAAPAVPGVVEAALAAREECGDGAGDGGGDSECPFDFVTCVLGVEYLTQPVAVLSEALRVLRPGGACIMAFTGRASLATKVVRVWAEASQAQRLWLAAAYLRSSRATDSSGTAWMFDGVEIVDLSPDPGRTDSLYIVRATKSRASATAAEGASPT